LFISRGHWGHWGHLGHWGHSYYLPNFLSFSIFLLKKYEKTFKIYSKKCVLHITFTNVITVAQT
jgi:hypothetical protein